MEPNFIYRKRVEFSETDAAGIVHFANYFRYMEMAEHAFFRSLGVSIHPRNSEYGFPRVYVDCNFRAPLHFEDELEVHVYVTEKREKKLTYRFEIFKMSAQGQSADQPLEAVATGAFAVVCVYWDPQTKSMKARPIPAEIAEKITVISK